MDNQEKSVIIYRSEDGSVQLEVQLYEETLWLNVHQMSQLFGRDEKTVRKHIKNALKEELCGEEVVANFATTTKHGAIAGKEQIHEVSFYNLDMIFSIGYRVKSQRGVDFRKWANMVLRNYLLRGYAVNNRLDRFLIIDDDVYLIGGSIKDLGKKVSTFVKLSIPKGEFLGKLL